MLLPDAVRKGGTADDDLTVERSYFNLLRAGLLSSTSMLALLRTVALHAVASAGAQRPA